MRHQQKIAIARLISDLIISDEVICHAEIAHYNRIVTMFDLSQDELYEAQFISLSDAFRSIQHLSKHDQQRLYSALSEAATSDNTCVACEALWLMTLSLLLNDTCDKYHLTSCPNHSWCTTDKYMVYIESDYMPTINEEIRAQYDTIVNLLQVWKFEFIYIPQLATSFCEMEPNYVFDIIRYTNPRLSADMITHLYKRLTNITTESYTRDFLANTTQDKHFYDIEPSLMISVGHSHVLNNQTKQESTFINLLTIRLQEHSVLQEVRDLLERYQQLITESEYLRPRVGKSAFRYHGFYKQLFDFLARKHTNGAENEIMIDIPARKIWMQGIEIQLTATQLATYVFILHQTYLTHYGGLIKAGQHHPLSEREVMRLGKAYRAISQLFRDTTTNNERSYLDEVSNIRGYITRIRAAITQHIAGTDVGFYLPLDTPDKSRCYIAIDPNKIWLRHAKGKCTFTDYELWKQL